MLPLVFSLLSASLGAVTILMLIRMHRAGRAVTALGAMGAEGLSGALVRMVVRALDGSMLRDARGGGLADIEVPFCEYQDPYRNVAELLNHIGKNLGAQRPYDVHQLIKNVYQLQASLGVSDADLDGCLRFLESRLRADPATGAAIARIETVLPGTHLDPMRMLPLTSGTHVKHVLGVIVIDQDGKVVSKAKVVCG